MKNRSHRFIFIKQHLSNIWSSIHKKIMKNTEVELILKLETLPMENLALLSLVERYIFKRVLVQPWESLMLPSSLLTIRKTSRHKINYKVSY